MLVDIYSIIVTIFYTMRLQLDRHDNVYIKLKYGKETLCHFAILNDSNLVGEHQTRLLDAIDASTTNQSANRDLASQNYGKQSGKKKDASPAYPNKPYPKKKGTGTAPSAKFNSVPFPQSSITAPGDGGTALQCPAKCRVLLCTVAEQVEEDWCPLHDPLLDQEWGTPPPPQCSPTLYSLQLPSGQSPDSICGGITFPSPLPRGHLPPWSPGDTSCITHRSGAKEERWQLTHH